MQLPPGKELQYGRVSAAELVQAVHEMLCSAGINMDVEKQSLLQTTLTLQEQLKESQAALLLEQVCNLPFFNLLNAFCQKNSELAMRALNNVHRISVSI